MDYYKLLLYMRLIQEETFLWRPGLGFSRSGVGDGKAILIASMSTDPKLHQGFRLYIPPTLRARSGLSRDLQGSWPQIERQPRRLSSLARAMSAQRAVSALQSLSDRSGDTQ